MKSSWYHHLAVYRLDQKWKGHVMRFQDFFFEGSKFVLSAFIENRSQNGRTDLRAFISIRMRVDWQSAYSASARFLNSRSSFSADLHSHFHSGLLPSSPDQVSLQSRGFCLKKSIILKKLNIFCHFNKHRLMFINNQYSSKQVTWKGEERGKIANRNPKPIFAFYFFSKLNYHCHLHEITHSTNMMRFR